MITFLNDYSAAKLFSRLFISIHSFLDSQLITDPLTLSPLPCRERRQNRFKLAGKKVSTLFSNLAR